MGPGLGDGPLGLPACPFGIPAYVDRARELVGDALPPAERRKWWDGNLKQILGASRQVLPLVPVTMPISSSRAASEGGSHAGYLCDASAPSRNP